MTLPIPCPKCGETPSLRRSVEKTHAGVFRDAVELRCKCRAVTAFSGVQVVALWNQECAEVTELPD